MFDAWHYLLEESQVEGSADAWTHLLSQQQGVIISDGYTAELEMQVDVFLTERLRVELAELTAVLDDARFSRGKRMTDISRKRGDT